MCSKILFFLQQQLSIQGSNGDLLPFGALLSGASPALITKPRVVSAQTGWGELTTWVLEPELEQDLCLLFKKKKIIASFETKIGKTKGDNPRFWGITCWPPQIGPYTCDTDLSRKWPGEEKMLPLGEFLWTLTTLTFLGQHVRNDQQLISWSTWN
jgi:hypothetical protein